MWTALVPARGGSKEVKGKNLRSVNGRPLILHTLDLLVQIPDLKIAVTTDNDQIRSTVLSHYPKMTLLDRDPALASDDATIDQVALAFYQAGMKPLLVVQPTTFGLTPQVVTDFITHATEHPGTWVATQPQEGIYWHKGKMLNRERTNRQESSSFLHKEVGLRAYSAPPTENFEPYRLDDPVIEIDKLGDFTNAEKDRAAIVINFTAGENQGWGHLHRALALYEALQHHYVRLACTPETTITAKNYVTKLTGVEPLTQPPFKRGIWINDTLDTDAEEIAKLISAGWKVICLEDQGPGARLAHVTINALYGDGDYNGVKFAILRPEFCDLPPYRLRPKGKEVMVSFGGESGDLGHRVLNEIKDLDIDINTIFPSARIPMAFSMQQADLLITSAGRTVYEAMAVGVPTVVLSANLREARHRHLGPEYGNLYLGPFETAINRLNETVKGLLDSPSLRREMSERGRQMVDGKGLARTVRIVEDLL